MKTVFFCALVSIGLFLHFSGIYPVSIPSENPFTKDAGSEVESGLVGASTELAGSDGAEDTAKPAPYIRPSDRRRIANGLPPRSLSEEAVPPTPPFSGSVEAASSDAVREFTPIRDGNHYIYLTFDDGPHYGTDDCLDVLSRYGIQGTFFVCGWNFEADQGAGRVAWNKRISQRIESEHVMANHSHSHRHSEYPDTTWFMEDMAQNLAEFENVHNGLPDGMAAMARLPTVNTWRLGADDSRNLTDRTQRGNGAVADELIEQGTRVFGWDVEWHFKRGRGGRIPKESAQEIYDKIERTRRNPERLRTEDHVVLLMHDNMFRQSADTHTELAVLIELLQEGGYTFATMDQYPVEPGPDIGVMEGASSNSIAQAGGM